MVDAVVFEDVALSAKDLGRVLQGEGCNPQGLKRSASGTGEAYLDQLQCVGDAVDDRYDGDLATGSPDARLDLERLLIDPDIRRTEG